ncbi:hypothetical protein [Cellulomonas sp.]|uniref:hypothetical protein n=1 Tax=Cellulomonas sp. TaxID=40001 RepID=UPI003BAAA332
MTERVGIYSGSNIRRTARMFGTAALVAAPLFALLGLAGILGLGSFGGTAPVEILSSAPAGSPVELRNSVHGDAVWGQPGVDLSAVTCEGSSSDGARTVDLDVGAVDGSPAEVVDAQGTGTWTRLSSTDALDGVSLVTCSGGGLQTVGVSVDPGDGKRGTPGALFLVFAAFLVVLGLVLRRTTAPQPR